MCKFPDYKRIGLFGMSHAGLDEQYRLGMLGFRGGSRKWLLFDLGHSVEVVLASLRGEIATHCDLFVGHVGNEDVARALERMDKPVLNIGGQVTRASWRTSGFDLEAVGELAAEYFLEAGFRNVLYVTKPDWQSGRAKGKAFLMRLEKEPLAFLAEMPFGKRRVERWLPQRKTESIDSMSDWLAKAPKPLAVFCDTDSTARELMDLAHFRGLQIPEQIAFLGSDNEQTLCAMCVVPLSSVELPARRVGALVARHIECLLQGLPPPAPQYLGPDRVVPRASSDLVAIDDSIVAKALTLMRQHAHERITIEAIVRTLPVSRRRFSDRFRARVGRSPREELSRLRWRMARDLLMDTDRTMFHIAMDCGFADAEAMAREFKRWEGLTPHAFRKKSRSA